jgi:hypothetical protein
MNLPSLLMKWECVIGRSPSPSKSPVLFGLLFNALTPSNLLAPFCPLYICCRKPVEDQPYLYQHLVVRTLYTEELKVGVQIFR